MRATTRPCTSVTIEPDGVPAEFVKKAHEGSDHLPTYELGDPDRTRMFLVRPGGESDYLAALDAIPDANTKVGMGRSSCLITSGYGTAHNYARNFATSRSEACTGTRFQEREALALADQSSDSIPVPGSLQAGPTWFERTFSSWLPFGRSSKFLVDASQNCR